MEKELEQFRQEAQRLKTGRRGGSLPFPEALRAFAVRYAAHTLEAGGTVVEAAQKLGVSGPTLYEWRKGRAAGTQARKRAQQQARLVPVEVSEPKGAAQPVSSARGSVAVVSPRGFRVEGLSLEAAAELLRRLGC
jgi:transposase-like protein